MYESHEKIDSILMNTSTWSKGVYYVFWSNDGAFLTSKYIRL